MLFPLFAVPFAHLALLPSFVSATPVPDNALHLPITKRFSSNTYSTKQLVENGQARLAALNARISGKPLAKRAVGSADATNVDDSYTVNVQFGTSKQSFDLIIDTGSSNTWVGAAKQLQPDGSVTDTGNTVSVSYGSGTMSGEEYDGPLTIGGLTVQHQSFGVASQANGFTGVDGILGFGPVDLTVGTVSGTGEVPTVMENLREQGTISENVLGVSFRPISGSETSEVNGLLTIGGTDSSKFTGGITYFPRVSLSLTELYWGLGGITIEYSNQDLELPDTVNTIVDTGTTLILIPTNAYNSFLSKSGGSTDSGSGLASWSSKPTGTFTINIQGKGFNLTPDQYLVPQAQYTDFGLASGKYYGWIADSGTSDPIEVSCIIGQKFLENYYSVFDASKLRIGFATAA